MFLGGSLRRPDIAVYVVAFDPRTGAVAHFRRDGQRLTSPVEIALECGCTATV